MLNYKGRYYAKEIKKQLIIIKDFLCEYKILKTSDLGENTNLANISASISTDFTATEIAAVLVTGYSENIRDSFSYMGEENLANLPEASKYYEDLNKIYESNSSNRGFEYFKLFYRCQYSVINCIENALLASEKIGTTAKRKGASFSFDTSLDNVIYLNSNRDDYTKVGLRYPGSEGKFIQIDKNDIYRSKVSSAAALSNPSSVNVSVIVNIPYKEEKELAKKLYPVVSTYKNRPIETVEIIPATEFIEILKEEYNATSSNVIVDMEAFYEQADKVSKQMLKEVVFFVTGKNKAYRVIDCEKKGEWPASVIKANSVSDLGNVQLLTKKGFDLQMARKNEKNHQSMKSAA